MNIVFYLLVLVFAVILWFLLSFIFFPLGKYLYNIFKEAINEMNRDDDNIKFS